MSEYKGAYAGKILRVDLSTRSIEVEPLKRELVGACIGGRGLSSRLLYNESVPGSDPFDPANPLIFSVGALFGTPVPAASRTTVAAKSPLSNLHGDAHSAGGFGASLRQAGFDAVVVTGKASEPVYVTIDDGDVKIRDASKIWGKTVDETHEEIVGEFHDRDVHTASIGPAGERLVRLAAIASDGGAGIFGRCGIGAVMGSKNLKALAARGSRDVKIVDVKGLLKAMDEYRGVLDVDPYAPPATKYGTPRFIHHRVKFGIHGANNWRYGEFDWQPLDPQVFRDKYTIKAGACRNCMMPCRREMVIPSGPNSGVYTKGPEWEIIARSITCGVNDPEVTIRAAKIQNQLGLDCEGVGDTIAFAMECYEKGLITKADTDGLELTFGNGEVMLEMMRRIGYREGLGDLLAEGTLRAAQELGRGAERYAIQVKGVEMTAGDPHPMVVRGVSYATSTRGSDHLRSNPYIEEMITPEQGKEWFGSEEAADLKGLAGKGSLIKYSEDLVTIGDLLGLCKFAFYRSASFDYLRKKGVELATRFYNACTGYDLSEADMLRAGERTFNVEKAFNVREGARRKDDSIPDRFFEEPLIGGPNDGTKIDRGDFDRVLNDYYVARGWDQDSGLPTRGTLDRLGLGDIADDLAKIGALAGEGEN